MYCMYLFIEEHWTGSIQPDAHHVPNSFAGAARAGGAGLHPADTYPAAMPARGDLRGHGHYGCSRDGVMLFVYMHTYTYTRTHTRSLAFYFAN